VAVRTRIDVAKEVAPKFGVTLQDADRFVLLMLDELKAMLMRGDEVTFKGFGRCRRRRGTHRTERLLGKKAESSGILKQVSAS
jgi:nucleoid DNA-binding protein